VTTDRLQQYVFGKTITREFYPLEGETPLRIPSQTCAFYLFEEKPSVEDAASGSGAVATGTQVSQSASSPYQIKYSFPPIQKPSDVSTAVFWESIKFVTETGGEESLVVRSLKLAVPENLDSIPGTTVKDLKDAFPSISNYLDDSELQAFIDLTEQELKLYFRSRGVLWSRIYDNQDLRLAIAFKAISDAAFSQVMSLNDRHHIRHTHFKEKYDSLLNLLVIKYDPSNEGQPSTYQKGSEGFIVLRR
jgi:hypothetical protein